MAKEIKVKVGPLKAEELEEAERIMRLAFGTFLGLPDPTHFMDDRNFMTPRFHSKHVKMIAAREGGQLIGTNAVTVWGSFGFFGPLTVLPEYWDRGVAKRLLEETVRIFDESGVKHSGLFTFAQSAKHVGLYQKFGYWPRYLTAIMTRTPEKAGGEPILLSKLPKGRRAEAIEACAKLTHKVQRGLDLTSEIEAALKQGAGEVALSYSRKSLDGFALCMHGPGSEGGEKICYVKFAAARPGEGAGERFSKLLRACDALAAAKGVNIEAGMNFAREDAYRRMRSHGFRPTVQGVAMLRSKKHGFNHADAYVIDDWR